MKKSPRDIDSNFLLRLNHRHKLVKAKWAKKRGALFVEKVAINLSIKETSLCEWNSHSVHVRAASVPRLKTIGPDLIGRHIRDAPASPDPAVRNAVSGRTLGSAPQLLPAPRFMRPVESRKVGASTNGLTGLGCPSQMRHRSSAVGADGRPMLCLMSPQNAQSPSAPVRLFDFSAWRSKVIRCRLLTDESDGFNCRPSRSARALLLLQPLRVRIGGFGNRFVLHPADIQQQHLVQRPRWAQLCDPSRTRRFGNLVRMPDGPCHEHSELPSSRLRLWRPA